MKGKFLEYFLLFAAGIYFLLGIFGIYTGIISVLSGSYADNIILGFIMAIGGPTVTIFGYLLIRTMRLRYEVKK